MSERVFSSQPWQQPETSEELRKAWAVLEGELYDDEIVIIDGVEVRPRPDRKADLVKDGTGIDIIYLDRMGSLQEFINQIQLSKREAALREGNDE